jgi:outer membrane protein OmpA-like peptidoglycan-associated protein
VSSPPLEGGIQGRIADRRSSGTDSHFDHDSAEFNDAEAIPAVEVIVSWLIANPGKGLNISGHTDSTGSTRYNEDLSLRRAEAAKVIFVAQGAEASRIRTFGYGETGLLVDFLGRERRNRRVEIEIFRIEEIVPEGETSN